MRSILSRERACSVGQETRGDHGTHDKAVLRCPDADADADADAGRRSSKLQVPAAAPTPPTIMSSADPSSSASPPEHSQALPSTSMRPAATIVVVRDALDGDGVEVLLLQRAARNDHNGSAWVFPGGVVDAGDGELSADLGVAADRVAALRECFEECGLLFARGADGDVPDDAALEPWRPWREPLNRGDRTMRELLLDSGLTLDVHAPRALSRWVTPRGVPKRFDTAFFIARAPVAQTVSVDGSETVDHLWCKPSRPLQRGSGMKLLTPTSKTLEMLASCRNVDDALERASREASTQPITPRLGRDRQGMRPVTPDEPAYAELGWLDPQGTGHASALIVPGVPVWLTPNVIRVTAPNPGLMTGPGTNSYLVGGGEAGAWAVIDPGPDVDAHLEALIAAAPGPIRWILVTHTHIDHSPLSRKLAERTGARVHGRLALHAQGQDASFVPDVTLADGDRVELEGTGLALDVFHTPGHASNHLCYRLDIASMFFAGDQVMQRATVVINPPDGDMGAYIASLRRLARDVGDLRWIAPAHGFLMDEPRRVLDGIVAHRLAREAKVLGALQGLARERPRVSLSQLVVRAYDDVPEGLHALATRSLTAHLLKLRDDGRVTVHEDGAWSMC
jgi:glyoxylase-like metal-dependent hydrolase (beta-lactamase superfamily II)/8-oxo-dGTP pyrophosphatase MutT (NUDIX family)